jgi:hypothetical protein
MFFGEEKEVFMPSNSDRRRRDYVEIAPLTFRCKSCAGEASYTFIPIHLATKFLGFGDHPAVPEILGGLTRCMAECDTEKKHNNIYKVIFFKCLQPGCTEYVMGTIEKDWCKDKDRIFNDLDEADLICIKGHKCTYHLLRK